MATITYKDYLKKTGKKPTAAAARAWDKLYNGGLRFDTSYTGAPIPEFKFDGPLDAQGQEEVNNLDYSNKVAQNKYETDFQAGQRELDAQGVQADYSRDEGYRSVDSNAGGRGVGRSGIKDTGRGEVLRNYLTSREGIERQRTGLTDQRQDQYDNLNADYQQNSINIRSNAALRRYQKWRDTQGGVV